MKTVFLDTVGLIAQVNRSDQWHADATAAFQLLQGEPYKFVLSTYILLESGNAVARTPLRSKIVELETTFSSTDQLIAPGESDWQSAWQAYQQAR